MSDKTYKIVEIVGTSATSFSDAVSNGVAKATKTLHNLSWFEVIEQRGTITDGKVAQFQATIKVGFRLD
jgi:dodecin